MCSMVSNRPLLSVRIDLQERRRGRISRSEGLEVFAGTHSYSSSTGSAFGWAMLATASEAAPKILESWSASVTVEGENWRAGRR